MTRIAVDALGWLGAVAVLSAYWLVSTRRAAGESLRQHPSATWVTPPAG